MAWREISLLLIKSSFNFDVELCDESEDWARPGGFLLLREKETPDVPSEANQLCNCHFTKSLNAISPGEGFTGGTFVIHRIYRIHRGSMCIFNILLSYYITRIKISNNPSLRLSAIIY
ncbi:hypothetical protein F5X96DRAFT_585360 [Biscogniauxia mediterranea]|nr:hypothetical protein F5X96DRAFT_585360 [Biscogniauxia mediterranea]